MYTEKLLPIYFVSYTYGRYIGGFLIKDNKATAADDTLKNIVRVYCIIVLGSVLNVLAETESVKKKLQKKY